jgi:hypothetical protein
MNALQKHTGGDQDISSIIDNMPKSMKSIQKKQEVWENFENYCLRLNIEELENMYDRYLIREMQQYENTQDQIDISLEENLLMIELFRKYLIQQLSSELSKEAEGRYKEISIRLDIKSDIKKTLN